MKKRLAVCGMLLIAIAFNFSCSKSSDPTPDPPTPPSPPALPLLTKVFELDTTLPKGKDTILKLLFTYDELNRIRQTFDSSDIGSYTNNPGSVRIARWNFEYQGTDTLPVRSIRYATYSYMPTYVQKDTSYFLRASGNYTGDSISLSGASISHYNFAMSSLSTLNSTMLYFNKGILYEKDDIAIHQTKINNQITYQLDTTTTNVYSAGPTKVNYLGRESTVTYESHPNPLFKTDPSAKPFLQDALILRTWNPEYLSRNLISTLKTKRRQWGDSGNNAATIYDISYNYTYRADGYPSEARVTAQGTMVNRKTKLIFIYDK